MIHLRIVAPAGLVGATLDVLGASNAVVNLIHLPGSSRKPPGDVILCDVVREEASIVIADLRELGIGESGSIAVHDVDTEISDLADRAETTALGSAADAVVWEEVESRTSESAELSFSFVAFMILATMIAAVGILTDSQILIIGAMVVGPEFGPLAGFCVAAVQRRRDLAQRSLVALGVGFPVAIAVTIVATLVWRAFGLGPEQLGKGTHPATLFISDPNTFSVIVALLAGTAGVLSLTTAKSGALMGVLISVTTIPAAGNIAVAIAYGDWAEWRGAQAQLLINLVSIAGAGVATLAVQRYFFTRRREEHQRQHPELRR